MLRQLFTGLALCFFFAGPSAALNCDDQGKPSFSAVRTITQNGQVISRSTVYFSPHWGEREERTLPGGERDVVLLLDAGTYMFSEDEGKGVFVPRPNLPERRPRQVSVTQDGANTKYTELVPGSDGSTAIGDVVICSPQGVPVRREYVAPTDDQRLLRFEMVHSNVTIQNLPRRLFRIPSNVNFVTPQG
jgi:hypothetical protein